MTPRGVRYKGLIGSIIVIMIFLFSSLINYILIDPKLPTAEAASIWTQTSERDFENGEFNNITMVGTGKNTDLIINMTQQYIWTKMNLSSYSRPRCQHAMAPIYGTTKVLLFGGLSGIAMNDTWTYDIITHTWTQKITKTSPQHRHLHAMASVYGDDKVVLFGGSYSGDNSGGQNRNDTWVYDLSENNWIKKDPQNHPIKRQRHAMASIYGDDKVMLFGGNNGYRNTDYNDTWVYDLSANTWTQKKPTNPPFFRDSHAMASIDGEDKVVLFGGRLYTSFGTEYYNDTWIYDLSDNTWTPKNQTTNPGYRCNHAMATIYDTDRVVMFGGFFRDWHLGDTWIYDLSQNKWITEVWLLGPSPRWMHAMAPVHGTDKVVLFGGNPDEIVVGRILNDTWIYQHFSDKKNGTYISIPYDTGSNSSFSKISWDAITPVDSSIKIQLRSAANMSLLSTQSFVGPDGSSITFYNKSDTEIWSGHTGDRWIQYKIYFGLDRFTETPRLKNVTITYNCLPNIIILNPINGSISTISTPTFKWTFKDFDSLNQHAFQVLISDDFNFTNVSYDSGIQKTPNEYWTFPMDTNYSNTVLPDGTWYWKARTQDEDGAWSKYSTIFMFKIDTYAPSSEPVVPANDGFYNWLPTISGIASEPTGGAGLVKVELIICRLNDNYYWDGIGWVPLPTWLKAMGTTEWKYDSNNVTWETGIKYCVQSRASDFGGNIELPDSENVFTIDELPPVSNIDSPVDGMWLSTLRTISGSSFDIHGSGVVNVEISIKCVEDDNTKDKEVKINDYWSGDKWKPSEAWLLVNGTEQWSYNSSAIQWSNGNQYLIRSRAADNADNLEHPGSGIAFNYDAIPPEQLFIQINNGEEYTQTEHVNLSLHAADVGSGCAQMAFSNDDYLGWSDWEPYTTDRAFILPTMDGEKTVFFRVKDYAGNIAEPVSDNIILDSTPPQELSIAINDNSKYTTSEQVILTLGAQDVGAGINEMSFSYDGSTWTEWLPFTTEIAFTLPPTDGEKTVYFRVSDKIGNVAVPISDSIILDSTPPHSLSIFINKGATETNQTSVTLDLFALDNLSGIDIMALSFDGINWSKWLNYIENRPYELPSGEGTKIIYFKVRDNAGNEAKPVTASIILTSPPEPSSSQPAEPSSSDFGFGFALIIIAIILVITFILGFVLYRKNKAHNKQKQIFGETQTLKPETLTLTGPTTSSEYLSATPQPTILPSSITTISPAPQLPAISTTQPQPQPQPAQETPQAQALPALPPVNTQEKDGNSVTRVPESGENAQ